MDGFDGQPGTEPGAVYGLRGWNLSAAASPGLMHGMYGRDWADGVNVAVCPDARQPPCPPPPPGSETDLARLQDLAVRLRVRHTVLQAAEHLACGPAEEQRLVAKRASIAAALIAVQNRVMIMSGQCGCGFWAYWAVPGAGRPGREHVYGVIEGSGAVLIGERGFRCERARIVALCPGLVPEALERAAPLYPSAQLFGDLGSMLAEFPASPAQAKPPAPREGETG